MDDNIGINAETTSVEASAQPEQSWINSLPEDIRGEASLAKFRDLGGLAKSYLSAEKLISSSVRIPGADATQEERDAFYSKVTAAGDLLRLPKEENSEEMSHIYNKLGRPEDPSKYEFDLITGEDHESPLISGLLKEGHEAGMTQKQMQTVLNYYNKAVETNLQALEAAKETAEASLKQAWGDRYEDNLNASKVAIKALQQKYPKEVESLVFGPNGNNPVLATILAEFGSRLKEGQTVTGEGVSAFNSAASNAKAKIDEIMKAGRDHPVWNTNHPNHRKAVAEMDELYIQAHS